MKLNGQVVDGNAKLTGDVRSWAVEQVHLTHDVGIFRLQAWQKRRDDVPRVEWRLVRTLGMFDLVVEMRLVT